MRTRLTVAALLLSSLGIAAPALAQEAGSALDSPTDAPIHERRDPWVQPARRGAVPTPPGYTYGGEPVETPRAERREVGGYSPTWALIIPGLPALLVPYLTGVFAAIIVLSGGGDDDAAWFFAPAVGAFYWAGQSFTADSQALFIAMGVSELAGIALITAGLALNRRGGEDPAEPTVSLVPIVGPQLSGLSLAGRF